MEPTTAATTADQASAGPAEAPSGPEATRPGTPTEELLVEEISIDGMCGVY